MVYDKNGNVIKSAVDGGWEVDSADATKALNMWVDYVGEDNALEDIAQATGNDNLEEDIEWISRQFGVAEEVEEYENVWDKHETMKELLGVHEYFENLWRSMGYDELAACMAFIFRQNDFQQWDEKEIYSSRKSIKSSVEPGEKVYFWLSDDAREKYFNTDELGNPAGDWEEGNRIMEILDDNFQQVWKEEVSSPEDGPSPNDLVSSGIYETTPRELRDFFDKGELDKSLIEVGHDYEEVPDEFGDNTYKLTDIIDIDSIINFED